MKNKYSVSEALSNVYALICTKIFYRNARLIRRPVYMRGKSSITFGEGFTTGHACRFDLPGGKKKTLFIGKNCQIGDYVHIAAHQSVIIGDNCLVASKVYISDTNHGDYSGDNQSSPQIPPNERELVTKPVVIGDNVWIGENVCILPGVTIGSGSIIGANSVVNKDIPENSIAVGAPAKVVKAYDKTSKTWKRVDN